MRKLFFCAASLIVAAAFCLPSWSQDQEQSKWIQLPYTDAVIHAGSTKTPWGDILVADDWKCAGGRPVAHVRWWGDYHLYERDNTDPVDPPDVRPTKFILSWHEAGDNQPGELIEEVEVPIDDQNLTEAYYGVVKDAWDIHWHIFQYDYYLETPWAQEAGKIYWLNVQAIQENLPIAEPYSWDWWGTETVEGLYNVAMQWDKVAHPDAPVWEKVAYYPDGMIEENMHMAFELFAMIPQAQIDLNGTAFGAGDALSATFVVNRAITQPFTAFAVIFLPNGSIINVVGLSTPLAPVATNIPSLPEGFNYQLLNVPAVGPGVPSGSYEILVALFDPTQPITGRADAFLEASGIFTIQE